MMMILLCDKCGKTITRNSTTETFRTFFTVHGYKSFCEGTGDYVFLIPIEKGHPVDKYRLRDIWEDVNGHRADHIQV